jgi:hypothetical protein
MPTGDPQAIRSLATQLRREAVELSDSVRRTAGSTDLPANRGAFADRARDTAGGLRERATWIATRIDAIAADLDRGAAWIEEAQREYLLANPTFEA